MILFKEEDKITKNVIVGERGKIIELFEDLTDKKNFGYFRTEVVIGPQIESEFKSDFYYSVNERLGNNGNGGLGHIYVKNIYRNSKPNSTVILGEALKTAGVQQQEEIWLSDFFGKNMAQVQVLENLLASVDPKTLEYMMTNFWEDFNYFCMQVLSTIKFEQVGEYKTTDLEIIKNFSDGTKVKFSTYKVLEDVPNITHVSKMEENARILKLAKNLKSKRF